MRSRSQPQHQHPRRRIAKRRHRPSPILKLRIGPAAHAGYLSAIRPQPLAALARNNPCVQLLKRFDCASHLRILAAPTCARARRSVLISLQRCAGPAKKCGAPFHSFIVKWVGNQKAPIQEAKRPPHRRWPEASCSRAFFERGPAEGVCPTAGGVEWLRNRNTLSPTGKPHSGRTGPGEFNCTFRDGLR
jgi:hypothetical protein